MPGSVKTLWTTWFCIAKINHATDAIEKLIFGLLSPAGF